ncbi:MAG: hypothetical protein K9N49_09610, partial [Candidatus Marinimicrobia bacterium]|nr:hypothetical protein [Candidatus Neomarinimicrobiota bacterium]
FFERLRAAGISVIWTDLDALPDSNRWYADPARFWGGLLGRWPWGRRWLSRRLWPNVLNRDGPRLSSAQLGRLLLFKANHRKLIISDDAGGGWHLLVTSLNPADGGAAHHNTALHVQGALARAVLHAEWAVADWSAQRSGQVLERTPGQARRDLTRLRELAGEADGPPPPAGGTAPRATWLTEGAIQGALLELLEATGPGDRIRAALFYLSDRQVVRALQAAAQRGATVHVLLDANRDAFGRRKNGVPNRPVARELMRTQAGRTGRLQVRWAETRGEQMHAKTLLITGPHETAPRLLLGSANWTRRNLDNLNLEANLLIEQDAAAACAAWFDAVWEDQGAWIRSQPYEALAVRGWRAVWLTGLYRFQEATGLCTH